VGLLLILIFFVLGTTGVFGEAAGAWVIASLIFIYFAAFWGYFALFEALAGGRTPGKRRVGIRVVMDTGHPITFQAAVIRNLVRIVDAQPVASYGVGLVAVLVHPVHKRLGDLVAGTIVVRDRPEETSVSTLDTKEEDAIDAGAPVLTDEEFQLVDRLVQRLFDLPADVRGRFARDLADRLADRIPHADPRPERFLRGLHASELAKRRAKSAARRGSGGITASGTAQRFVAARQASWESFRAEAAQLERLGLRGLTGKRLVDFAARYREVAADLARARTYGADSRVLAFLERVVSAGHNALYGLRGVRRMPVGRLLMSDLPHAVYRARWYVTIAALLFVLPGIVGYALVRDQPDIVHEVLPDGMIARAESGALQRGAGRGYAETPSPYLPIVATGIIANNVQVAFGAFAFGITAGIGTVFLLVFNGLFFGAVLGMFANYALADWILTFVAGHGVLELTAIFIAGAAGLIVARNLVAPGDLARRDALVVGGRWAVKLVGAAACLLVLAGLIEGFLSASDAPATLKLAVSGASAALLILLWTAGRAVERTVA
jgi:uncharacterized membrane protein SpoIIM required for sporulation/uncharacterized RDD family membrane protein YckC